jgi:hypothetical protein
MLLRVRLEPNEVERKLDVLGACFIQAQLQYEWDFAREYAAGHNSKCSKGDVIGESGGFRCSFGDASCVSDGYWASATGHPLGEDILLEMQSRRALFDSVLESRATAVIVSCAFGARARPISDLGYLHSRRRNLAMKRGRYLPRYLREAIRSCHFRTQDGS